eukprot:gb/GECG01007113.1/.p1 GENE.gb/GECG01007113.1/~~gb/GECG01007113.1/.p1  ORF type:complete len:394 (+),score=45.51 gb/GECG01007113.1/:1-1182(+)
MQHCGKTVAEKSWDLLITYTTERVVLYKDARIGLLHKGCIVALAIYLIFEILSSHAYMRKVSPQTSVNAWIDGNKTLNRLKNIRDGVEAAPSYCGSDDTEYTYGPGFTYFDNTCDDSAVLAEIFHKGSTSVAFVSYYQDTPLDRVGKGRPVNAFIPAIEDINLFFSHGFTTALGIGDANVESKLQSDNGKLSKKFENGEPVHIKLSELLEMAGIDLDARHKDSGGAPPTPGTKWPIYRMTGVDITVEMKYQNFRSDSVFDFSHFLDAKVSATQGVWSSRGQQLHSKWNETEGQLIPFERYPQVIAVRFKASGEIGRPDPFTAVMNIAVGAAIFGVAKHIVDTAGNFIIREFYDKKNLDHGDFTVMDYMKKRMWDEDDEKLKSKRQIHFEEDKV